ncbi:hypothetical protein BO94DRAFT_162475 [Aspergillus sclerotioniger CBS 115572]|uniref:Uncharacterized protein n=1 Tax=Aspergillus sclerotioniger CBS 115572 TaxID=1450535 RepID=A0A317W609_9EURO|nr:hypothetical protein BO94DRAFT_162475 [Aspergillus sclerotioniger CBS 115572]PWY80458.1 hypothetical protein BO94DRAFT_162475 [Aspergillus sclerotioniger CBS 115572]
MVCHYNIHQICLASTISPANPVHPKASSREIQDQQNESFNSKLEALTGGYSGIINNGSPNPLLVPAKLHRSVARIHEALVLGLTNIVERWCADEQAVFSRRMPLEPHEEDLLRWLHEQACEKNLRQFWECQGHWRTDFLLSAEWPRSLQICEINTRYSINAQLIAAYGYEVYGQMASERSVFAATDAEEFVQSQLELFDSRFPVHIINDQHLTSFVEMFVSYAERNTGLQPTIVKPSDLRLVQDHESATGHSLYCKSTREHPDLVENGEPLDRIYQTGMYLLPHELRSMPVEILRQLALCCVNDMRSILLIHDKRILGILLEELDSLVEQHRILTAEQAELLRQGVVPTINPGSAKLEQFIDQCTKTNTANDSYIIKPVRSARGEGILLGKELSPTQWEALLIDMRDPKLAPGRAVYIIQPLIRQSVFEVIDHRGDSQVCPIVGCSHLANGKFTGLGCWRAGGTEVCNMNNRAFWTMGVVARPS